MHDTCCVFLFQIQSFIQQILEGVGHIHSMNILHLDIKVSALLLSAVHYLLFMNLSTFHKVSFSYFFLLAWEYPHGVSPKRRDQNLWLWLLPGNRHIQAPVQHVWDAWICCPRNCSPRTSNCGHWYLVSLTATCILDINQILYISLHPDAETTL